MSDTHTNPTTPDERFPSLAELATQARPRRPQPNDDVTIRNSGGHLAHGYIRRAEERADGRWLQITPDPSNRRAFETYWAPERELTCEVPQDQQFVAGNQPGFDGVLARMLARKRQFIRQLLTDVPAGDTTFEHVKRAANGNATPDSSSRITPVTMPELKGGRYRVYTIEHLPFDALLSRDNVGPALVAVSVWVVSTVSRIAEPGEPSDGKYTYTLGAFRFTNRELLADPVQHPLDGTKYATPRDCLRALYEAGLVGFMVYENEAAWYGLPTADDTQHD